MLNSYKQTSLLRQEASLPNIPDTIFLETEGIGQIIKNMLQQLRHANINLTETLADQLRSNFETLSLSVIYGRSPDVKARFKPSPLILC